MMMKNILKSISIIVFCLMIFGCEKSENPFYDNVNGQTGIYFTQNNSIVGVAEEGTSVEIPVGISTISSEERTFQAQANSSSTAPTEDYNIGDIIIPANSYTGSMTVSFDNFQNMSDDDNVLSIGIVTEGDDVVFNSGGSFGSVSIIYFKEIVCGNDFTLEITTDIYGDETTWEVENETGDILASGGPYGPPSLTPQNIVETFTLPEGNYTFTIFDSFGDGQEGSFQGTTLIGNYQLSCSTTVVASGEGAFDNGTFESAVFVVE
jgi:hypothetical protein